MTLDEVTERYHMTELISQNMNCVVRLAIHTQTKEQVCFKIFTKSSLISSHKSYLVFREISTLKMLKNSKNITELYEAIDTGDRIWMVLEYAAGGELFDFIREKAPLSEKIVRDIFLPIVKVVAYMHSLNLVHRDLKLENIILDSKGKLHLTDFGFSRKYDPEDGLIDSICGTPHYSAPEIISGSSHNPVLADSWALGVILYIFFWRVSFSGWINS
jgi:serine/threonine protein kinase